MPALLLFILVPQFATMRIFYYHLQVSTTGYDFIMILLLGFFGAIDCTRLIKKMPFIYYVYAFQWIIYNLYNYIIKKVDVWSIYHFLKTVYGLPGFKPGWEASIERLIEWQTPSKYPLRSITATFQSPMLLETKNSFYTSSNFWQTF